MDFILCDICGVSKLTNFEINDHKRKAHGTRVLNCKHCNKEIIGNDRLLTHLKTHETKKCAKCNLDIKRFSINHHITKGMPNINQIPGEKHILCCKKCNKYETPYRNSLKRHQATCQIDKPKKTQLKHSCSICDQAYPTKYLLNKHIKENHETAKVYYCDIDSCEKTFSRKYHLQRHIKDVHEEKKVIPSKQCGICNKVSRY